MKLSPNFSLAEYADSDTAVRLGIDNTPPETLLHNLRQNALVLELIKSALSKEKGVNVPVIVLSGYRCEELEKVVARSDFLSWCNTHHEDEYEAWAEYFSSKGHPQGKCADVRAPTFGTPAEIANFIASRPEIMQHIDKLIMEGTWLHVATSEKPRGIVMTAKFDAKGIPTYENGLA
jgi:zinc D-Ala-D-Ala carboxypeptidase